MGSVSTEDVVEVTSAATVDLIICAVVLGAARAAPRPWMRLPVAVAGLGALQAVIRRVERARAERRRAKRASWIVDAVRATEAARASRAMRHPVGVNMATGGTDAALKDFFEFDDGPT